MPVEDDKSVPFYKRALIDRSGGQDGEAVVEGSDDDEDFKAFLQRKLFARMAAEEAAGKSLKRSAVDAIATPVAGQIESLGLRAMGRGLEADAVVRWSEAQTAAAMARTPEMAEATGIPNAVINPVLSAAQSTAYSLPAIAGGPVGLGATVGAITATSLNSNYVEGKDAGLRGGSLAVSTGLKGTGDAAAMMVMQKLNMPGLEGIFGKVAKDGAAKSIGKGIADAMRRFGRANAEEIVEEEGAMIWDNLLSQWTGTASEDLTLESLYEQAKDTAASTIAQVSAFSAIAEGTKVYSDIQHKKRLAGRSQTLGGPTPSAGGPTPPAGGPTPPAGGPTPPAGGPTPSAGGPTPSAGPAPVDPTMPPGPAAAPAPPAPGNKGFPIDMQIETIDGILADGQPRTLAEISVEIANLGLNPESFAEGIAGAAKQAAMGGKYEQAMTPDGNMPGEFKIYLAAEEDAEADAEVDTVPLAEAAVEPAVEPDPEDTTGLRAMGSGMADGIGYSLRKQLWEGYSANTGVFKDDPVVKAARYIERNRNGVMEEEEFVRMAEELSAAEGRDARKAVADKYIGEQAAPVVEPAAEAAPEATPQVDGLAELSGLADSQQRLKYINENKLKKHNIASNTLSNGDRVYEYLSNKSGVLELGTASNGMKVMRVSFDDGTQGSFSNMNWMLKVDEFGKPQKPGNTQSPQEVSGGNATTAAPGKNSTAEAIKHATNLAAIANITSLEALDQWVASNQEAVATGRLDIAIEQRRYVISPPTPSPSKAGVGPAFGGTAPKVAPEVTPEPAPGVDNRESMWKGYSEQTGDMLDDPVVGAAKFIEKSRGRALDQDEFNRFGDEFIAAEPGDARQEIAGKYITSPAPVAAEVEPVAPPAPTDKITAAIVANGGFDKNSADDVDAIRTSLYEPGGKTPSHDDIRAVMQDMKNQQGEQPTPAKARLGQAEIKAPEPEADAIPEAVTRDEIASLPIHSVYRVPRKDGVRFAVRGDSNNGFGDTLHDTPEEAKESAEAEKAAAQRKTEWQAKMAADEAEAARNESEAVASYRGFDADSPMRFGKARKALEQQVRNGGKVTTRKDLIEDRVKQGWRVVDATESSTLTDAQRKKYVTERLEENRRNGRSARFQELSEILDRGSVENKVQRLEGPDGVFLDESAVTKTGMRYAKFIADQDQAKPEPPKSATPEYQALPAKTRDLFQTAMDGKDSAKLMEILHEGGKLGRSPHAWSAKTFRAEFGARTGFKLPSSRSGTKAAIDSWVAGDQPAPEPKASLGKPKATEPEAEIEQPSDGENDDRFIKRLLAEREGLAVGLREAMASKDEADIARVKGRLGQIRAAVRAAEARQDAIKAEATAKAAAKEAERAKANEGLPSGFDRADLAEIRKRVEAGDKVFMFQGDKIGLQTPQQALGTGADHVGSGYFVTKTPKYEVSWTAGGGSERAANGTAYTVARVSRGELPYDKAAVLAAIDKTLGVKPEADATSEEGADVDSISDEELMDAAMSPNVASAPAADPAPAKPSLGTGKSSTSTPRKPSSKPKTKFGEKLTAAADKAEADYDNKWDALKALMDGRVSMNPMLDPAFQQAAAQLVVAGVRAKTLRFAVFIEQGLARLGEDNMRTLGPLLERSWDAVQDRFKFKGMDRSSDTNQLIDQLQGKANGNEETGTEPDDDIQADPRDGRMADGAGSSDGALADGDAGQDPVTDVESGTGRPGLGLPESDAVSAGANGRPEPDRNGKGKDSGKDTVRGGKSGSDGNAANDSGSKSPGEAVSAADPNAVNHQIGPNDSLAVSGVKTSFKRNVAAIQLAKMLEREGRHATPSEKAELAQFTGWGGIAPVFNKDLARHWELHQESVARRPYGGHYIGDEVKKWGELWYDEHQELKSVLTEDEWSDARNSTRNAHYTDRRVIDGMWAIAERMGFTGGMVAEFGAGVGHFAGLMPKSLRASSKFVMVERDTMSARIATLLYPQHEVIGKDLAEVNLKPGSVSLGIGNFPFDNKLIDDAMDRYGISLNLHNYFFARMADALAPGGIAIVISTHHTLDSSSDQRKFLAERFDLLGAVRLPNNAFMENAKTKVTTDILVLRKKEGGKQIGEPMIETTLLKLTNRDGIRVPVPVNSYFVQHPEMALGTHSATGQLRAKKSEYTLEPDPNITDIADAIADRAAKIKSPAEITQTATDESAVAAKKETAVEGHVRLDGGIPVVYAGGQWVKIGEGKRPNDNIPAGLFTKPAVQRAKDYVGLSQAYANLRKTMVSQESSDATIRDQQSSLGKKYDAYIKMHGYLNERGTNVFAQDGDYSRVVSLETVIEKTNFETKKVETTYRKADVFTKRTLGAIVEPESAETTRDAVYISLGRTGRIDLPYIARLRSATVEQVREELLADETMFLDPASGEIEFQDEYLAGNVRKKLAAAEFAAKADAIFERNVAALTAVQPPRRTLSGTDPISVSLGDSWIPIDTVLAFASSYYRTRQDNIDIEFDEIQDRYDVNVLDMTYEQSMQRGVNIGPMEVDGVRLPGVEITGKKVFAKLMNRDTYQDVKVKIPNPNGEGETSVTHPIATAALHKAFHNIQEGFATFLKSNANHATAVEDSFNIEKNSHRDATYDGSHLTFPGKTPGIDLRDYQKNVIWRIIKTGRVLMAHAVGAGKTYAMIGAAMELKRLGLAKRSVLVVKTSTLGQFAKSFMTMYPNANVLVASSADLGAGKREAFLYRVASGDYDAVVIAESTFQNLASAKESENEYIESIVQQAEDELYSLRVEQGSKSPAVKDLVRYLDSIRSKLGKLTRSGDTAREKQAVTFDDLGVDAIFLDEAHAYKKPFFLTKLQQLVGLNKDPSIIAMSTQAKIATIRKKTGGRNIVLATGTPITNTLGEAYHMSTFLAPDINEDHGVKTFDRFIGAFATVNLILKQNAGGAMVMKPAIEKFRNGNELIRYLRRTWDIVTPDQLRDEVNAKAAKDGKNGIPTMRGGRPELVVVARPKSTGRFMNYLLDAYKQYMDLPGAGKRDFNYIPVLLQGSARAASMDMRLIYPDSVKEPGGKVEASANRIWQEYVASQDIRGTQLVFSDIKNPRSMQRLQDFVGGAVSYIAADDSDSKGDDDTKEQTYLFDQITAELVKKGIPRDQIAYVTDAKNDKQKLALFDRVNSGEIRVIMGGTQSLGTGANVQERVVALHELDAPYMPSESEQRLGRALRFGNINKEVAIIRYAMKNTLDASIFDAALRKAKFIWQVLSGQAGNDFDDPVSETTIALEEAVAAISGSPLPKEKIQLEHQIRDLLSSETAFHEQQASAKERLEYSKKERQRYVREVVPRSNQRAEEIVPIVAATKTDGAWIDTGDGKRITDIKKLEDFFKKAGERLIAEIVDAAKKMNRRPDTRDFRTTPFVMNGMEAWIAVDSVSPVFSENSDKIVDFTASVSVRLALPSEPNLNLYHGSAKTAAGTHQQIIKLEEILVDAANGNQKRAEDMAGVIEQIQADMKTEWEDAAELAEKQARLEVVKQEIQAGSMVDRESEDADDDAPPSGPIDVSDLMGTDADADDVGEANHTDALKQGDDTTPPEPPAPIHAPPPPGIDSFISPKLQNKQSMGSRKQTVFSAKDLVENYESDADVEAQLKSYRGPDTELENRLDNAHLSPLTWMERIKEFFVGAKNNTMRGALPELPRTEQMGEARSLFRLALDSPHTAFWKVNDILRKTMKGLNKADLNLFTRAVIFRDLKNRKGALPFKLTPDRAEAERVRVEALVLGNPRVQAALQYRGEWQEEMKAAYIYWHRRNGTDLSNKLANEDYFRHQVLWHYRLRQKGLAGAGGGKKMQINTSRGFLAHAKGSDLDINFDYLQAEWEVATQMIADTIKAEAMAKLNDHYGQLDKLEHAAKMANLYALYGGRDKYNAVVKLREDRQKAKKKDRPSISAMLKKIDPLFTFKQNIAIASQRLMSAEPWLASLPQAAFMKEVSRMESDPSSSSSELAAAFLGAVNRQKMFIKDKLGDDFKTWDQLMDPETHRQVAVRHGRAMFQAHAIPDKMANELLQGHANSLEIQADQLKAVLVAGAEYTPMVLPHEIANQMEHVQKTLGDNALANTVRFLVNRQRDWKGIKLLNPLNIIKYITRNLSEIDKLINLVPQAAHPKMLRRAGKEIHAVLSHHEDITPEAQKFFELGAAQSLDAAQDMFKLADQREFMRFFDHDKGWADLPKKMWDGYWRWARKMNNYQLVYRYSAFLVYRDQIKAKGRPNNYGGSTRAEIDGIQDVDRKAIRLANDVLGAYEDVSPVGQVLRDSAIPFWSFTETNSRTYVNGIINIAHDEKVAKAYGESLLKAMGVAAVQRSPHLAFRFGQIALLLYGFQWSLDAWNYMFFSDDEDDIPDEVQERPHLRMGRNADGTVRYFDRLGTSTDFLDWFGLDAGSFYAKQYMNGRMTIADIGYEMAWSPWNKIAQGTTPYLKGLGGVALGKDIFPDVRNPRTIRDRWEYAAQIFSLEKPYRLLSGKPSKGLGSEIRKMFWYEVDPGSASYYRNRDQIKKFTGKGAFSSDSITPKAEALYQYKKAIQFGDKSAEESYKAEYEMHGGTDKTMLQSLKMLHPLGQLSIPNEIRYLSKLDQRGKDELVQAEKYFYEQLVTPEQAAAVKEARRNRVVDTVKTVMTFADRPDPDTNSDYATASEKYETDYADLKQWVEANRDAPDVQAAVREVLRSDRFRAVEAAKVSEPRRGPKETGREWRDRQARQPAKVRQAREDAKAAREWRKWVADQS